MTRMRLIMGLALTIFADGSSQGGPDQAKALAARGYECVVRDGHVVEINVKMRQEIKPGDFALINACAELERLNLAATWLDDRELLNLRPSKIKELILAKNKLSDECMEHVSKFRELRLLDLSSNHHNQITGKSLGKLAACSHLERLNLERTAIEEVKGLAGCKSLRELNLEDTQVDDEGAKGLTGCESLRELNLASTKVTDKAFADLELPNLERLRLAFTKVEALDGKLFRTATKLRMLCLARTPVDDAALGRLSKLTKMDHLDLNGTFVERGLAQLHTMKSLRRLTLSNTVVDDEGLKGLLRVPSLAILELDSNGTLTDEGLKNLSAMPNLTELTVGSDGAFDPPCSITDDGLKHLTALKKLRKLDVIGVSVTPGTTELLKKANPSLVIKVPEPATLP